MHKRRSSQPFEEYHANTFSNGYNHDTGAGYGGSEYQPPPSASSSNLQYRRSSASGNSPSRSRRSSKQYGRARASSSAIGIDFDLDTDDDAFDEYAHAHAHAQAQQGVYPPSSTSIRRPQDPYATMPSPSSSSSHVLPFSLSRPGRSRISLTMLLLLAFLSAVFLFSLFPASRDRGKAAVDSIGGYAGQVWQEWKPPMIPGMGKSGANRIRERPALHEDPNKTTRCTTSFDGKRNVVQYAIMIDAGSTGSRVHVYKVSLEHG